jgi:hypothetical protein
MEGESMKTKVRKFLSILKVELEDFEEDLTVLLEGYKLSEEKRLITEYVSKENSSLVKHQISAIKVLLREIETFPIGEYADFDSFEKTVIDFLTGETQKRGFPKALIYVIERKVHKVRSYIEEGC